MKEFLSKCDETVENYAEKKLKESAEAIYQLQDTTVEANEEVIEKVIEANKWVAFCAGDNQELYDEYSFKVFFYKEKLFIVQGFWIDADPELPESE